MQSPMPAQAQQITLKVALFIFFGPNLCDTFSFLISPRKTTHLRRDFIDVARGTKLSVEKHL